MGRLISLMSVGSLAERNRAGAECFITVSTRSDMSTPVSGTEVFCVVCAGVGTWLIEHGLLNLTRRARNLKVIDLAIERLAFWNEYLKAVEVAGDRQQMRDRAFDRILHVVEYADAELQKLSWVQTQWRAIVTERAKSPRRRRFPIRVPASVRESDKRAWRRHT